MIPDKINLHVTTDLILRGLRSKRLEGSQHGRLSPPSFETPRNSARLLADEVDVHASRRPNTRPRSRDARRPRFGSNSVPPRKGGRREDRVRAAPAVSCAKCTSKNAHEHTGSAETLRPSLRNGFTDYTCSPRRSGFLATVASRTWLACARQAGLASARLDANPEASGPHDFTVRFSIVRRPAVRSLTELIPPCNHLRARRCRVHRIPPRVS